MTLWIVNKHFYVNADKPVYDVEPYNLWGHLKCCCKYYGLRRLKNAFLFKRQAEKRAQRLNNEVK